MRTSRTFLTSAALFSVLACVLIACKTSPPSAPVDTAPTVSITSPVNNEVCRLVDTIYVDASDDKAVTKVELYINGSLVGTDQASPWRFIWDTEQWDDGDYEVHAKAYDAASHSATSTSVTMTIRNAFPVTFFNSTHTTMSVTAYNVTRSIAPNDSTIYTLSTNPRSLVFSATTSGKTSGGTVVGLVLAWGGSGNPIDVSTMTSASLNLQVSSTYFFMYISNSGAALGPLYVNYGLTDQTVDNIYLPSDGVKYSIGYYRAHSGAIVRAYKYPSTTLYVYWTLAFPFTVNQALWLNNTLAKSGTSAPGLTAQAGEVVQIARGVTGRTIKPVPGSNTLTLFQND